MRLSIVFIVILAFVNITYATDYHVATTGNDTTGDGLAEGTAWHTPEYGAKQLAAGDTLYIHAGTYVLSADNIPGGASSLARDKPYVSPPYNIDGTSENPFTITNYENDVVVLDAGTSPQYPAVGANYGDYVIVDGVSVRGAAVFMWTSYSTIQNCDLYGGIDAPEANGGDNFGCVLRVEGGTGCLVKNNKLHDNQIGITQLNSPLLMEYDSTNLVIENNDFYNSVSIAIRLKDDPETVTVRFNYIYDNTQAGIVSANQDTGHDISIYQNIFRNNNTSDSTAYSGDVTQLVEAHGWYVYNNTFVGSNYANILGSNSSASISGINVWNNIFSSDSNSFYRLNYGANFAAQWDYSDYNNFYGSANWAETSTWSTLAAYQSGNSEGFDANSINSNPNFINASGTSPEDYKRSSYPTDGRSGEYETVIGAYVTGNETIGYSSATSGSKFEQSGSPGTSTFGQDSGSPGTSKWEQ